MRRSSRQPTYPETGTFEEAPASAGLGDGDVAPPEVLMGAVDQARTH